MLFKRKLIVRHNHLGLLFKEERLQEVLKPGHYDFWDWKRKMKLIEVPTALQMNYVTGQEVLSKDRIAFRFSFSFSFQVADVQLLMQQFDLSKAHGIVLHDASQWLHRKIQTFLRSRFTELDSELITLNNFQQFEATEVLKTEIASYGLELMELMLIDVNFPKKIQDLFSKQLEAQQKAKAEIETARSAVASARALKNAAKIIEGDEYIRFIKTMDTLSKMSENGKHTFVIGDMKLNSIL